MLTNTDVITQIERRLAGTLSAAALSEWAFDRFYALEQAEETVDEVYAEVIGEVLDDLMFADDDDFALEPADLQRMIARLHHG